MKNWRWLTLQKVALWLVGIIVLVGIIGGGNAFATERNKKQQQANVESILLEQTANLNQTGTIAQQINSLYQSNEHVYLVENLTKEQVSNARLALEKSGKTITELVKDYPDVDTTEYTNAKEQLQQLADTARAKFLIQEDVNAWFEGTTKAINGNKVVTDLVATKGMTEAAIAAVNDKLADLETDRWKDSINAIVQNANTQLAQHKSATETVNALFDGDIVKEDVTEESYTNAKNLVDAIRNETLRKELNDKLTAVRSKLDEKRAAEEALARAAEEAALAAEEEDSTTEDSENVWNPDTGAGSWNGGNNSGGSSGGGNTYNPPTGSGTGDIDGGSGGSGGDGGATNPGGSDGGDTGNSDDGSSNPGGNPAEGNGDGGLETESETGVS